MGGGRPERRIDGGAKLQEAPMVTGGGWSDSGRGEAGLGLVTVEEVLGKMLA